MADSEGVYLILRQYNSMLQDALREAPSAIEYRNVQRVIVCGMGGSGVIGDFLAALVPRCVVHVAKEYHLPEWAGHHDLVFCISYSGNTEETLSCFSEARRRGCLVHVITSGGKLLSLARDGGVAHARIPSGLPPRFATVHMLVPALAVLQELGVSEAYERLPHHVAVDEEYAKAIAAQLRGKTPLVYASERNRVLAEKLKTDINENAKVPAFFNTFPEANHNELSSYEHITPNYVAVFLRHAADGPRVSKRMDVVKRLLSERDVRAVEVTLGSAGAEELLLQANLLCLLISYHLAILYGVDPGPVELIEEFKRLITQE